MYLNYDDLHHRFVEPFSPATFHENVFSPEQLEEFSSFMFRKTLRWRVSESGNLFFAGNLEEIYRIIKPSIKNFIDLNGVTKVIGNFFHTPHQYGLHTDMPETDHGGFVSGHYAFKSILIPLYKLPKRADCHIIYFKERLVGPGTTMDRGNAKSITHYNSCTDYSTLTSLYNVDKQPIRYEESEFDQEIYEKYDLKRTSPIERFNGFHVEAIYPWEPGTISIFDTTQLHCSNMGIGKRTFRAKAGLRLSLWKNYKGRGEDL